VPIDPSLDIAPPPTMQPHATKPNQNVPLNHYMYDNITAISNTNHLQTFHREVSIELENRTSTPVVHIRPDLSGRTATELQIILVAIMDQVITILHRTQVSLSEAAYVTRYSDRGSKNLPAFPKGHV